MMTVIKPQLTYYNMILTMTSFFFITHMKSIVFQCNANFKALKKSFRIEKTTHSYLIKGFFFVNHIHQKKAH